MPRLLATLLLATFAVAAIGVVLVGQHVGQQLTPDVPAVEVILDTTDRPAEPTGHVGRILLDLPVTQPTT